MIILLGVNDLQEAWVTFVKGQTYKYINESSIKYEMNAGVTFLCWIG